MGGAVVQLLAGGCVALQKEGCGFDSFIQGLSVWRFHILCLSEWLLCRPYFLFSDFSEPHLHHKTTGLNKLQQPCNPEWGGRANRRMGFLQETEHFYLFFLLKSIT